MAINTDLVSFYDLATGADSIGGYTLTAANGAAFSGVATLPNFNSSIYAATQIPLGGGDFSVSFWFKDLKNRASATSNFLMFCGHSSGGSAGSGSGAGRYPVVVYTNDELGVWSDGVGFSSTGVQVTQASTGASWHLLNAVFDSSSNTMTVYMDGVQVGGALNFSPSSTIQTFGSFTNLNYNASENMDDIAVWSRKITPTEIGQIYSAGQGGFSGLLQATAINMWGSLVHSADPNYAVASNMWGSIVHDAPPNYAVASNMWGSIIHDAPPNYAVASNMWGSMVHGGEAPQTASVTNMWGSIVHNSPPNYAVAANMWGSIVHSAEPNYAVASNMWGTLVHSGSGSSPSPGTPVISASSPTVKLVSAIGDAGYVINTYSNNLLSVQRARTVDQVPFRLGTKGKQSLRDRTNTEFTGSS